MTLLRRQLCDVIDGLRRGYPAVSITGPRQSGKTTLARTAFDDLPYVNFESPLERATFEADPMGFLSRYSDGAILDEVQNIPEVLSYLQVRIDEDRRMGRWVVTGSRQIDLGREVSQSLAGRVAMLSLQPFAFAELSESPRRPTTLPAAVLRGGYPPLYDPDRELEPVRWLEDYVTTFVARDVPSVMAVRNRSAFDRFIRMAASRSGQVFESSTLARDLGIDAKTVASWTAVLEECGVVFLLRPHHRNFGKRLVKRPKLYFVDSGLACRLLSISDVNQLTTHPLWGALVETWCVGEVRKARLHRALPPQLWFWRSSDGHEVDLVLELGARLLPIEIKATISADPSHARRIAGLRRLAGPDSATDVAPGLVIYGGHDDRVVGGDRFVPWSGIDHRIQGLA
jgi:hypothetical protein